MNKTEKIKEESNWYAESSDNDEVLHDYYEVSHSRFMQSSVACSIIHVAALK